MLCFAFSSSGDTFLFTSQLAAYDVILTTYDLLRSEVHFSKEYQAVRQLRHERKHKPPLTPLVQIQFWRICLDEAQMVESTTAKAAEMAQRLKGVNKWAITGTPIGKNGVDDLYGLLLFLDKTPWSDHTWWASLNRISGIILPFHFILLILSRLCFLERERVISSLLGDFLWRTRKRDVLDEIRLPPQREEVILLGISQIENVNYRHLHSQCVEKVRTHLFVRNEHGESPVTAHEVNSLILQLRQTWFAFIVTL